MWFDQASPEDLNYLAQYGVWGGVPAVPVCLPGLGRYGRYQFDRYLLLQKNDLTIAQRREVIFLAEYFHKIDHFEFFELNAEATEREIKKAFFRLSKRFHPDAVRGMQLGHFAEHVRLVFEYGQQARDLLLDDQAFRETYSRVTQARDLAYQKRLETERERQHQRVANARAQGITPPGQPKRLAQVAGSESQRSQAEIDKRKSLLRERLAQNQDRRQAHEKSKQTADLKSQARTFFMAGEQAESRGQMNRALNHFKLCVEYMPKEVKYREALKRIEAKVAEEKAQTLWTEAESLFNSEESIQKQAALDIFREACELSPTERRLVTFTQHSMEFDLLEEVIPLLKQAHKKAPMNLEYMWLLCQCHEQEKSLAETQKYMELILSLDPSEPRALRLKKRYRF